MEHIVGLSDMFVSGDLEDHIVTYSLGSCVGVSIYDPVAKVGGMLHCMLPLSSVNPQMAKDNPCIFVDTGVPALLQAAYALGASNKNIIVRASGAGRLLDKKNFFKIGERNCIVLGKILEKNNLVITGQDTRVQNRGH